MSRTEGRGQKSEDRRLRTDDRGQKPEVRLLKWEFGKLKSVYRNIGFFQKKDRIPSFDIRHSSFVNCKGHSSIVIRHFFQHSSLGICRSRHCVSFFSSAFSWLSCFSNCPRISCTCRCHSSSASRLGATAVPVIAYFISRRSLICRERFCAAS